MIEFDPLRGSTARHQVIQDHRDIGTTWDEIGRIMNLGTGNAVRKAHKRWRARIVPESAQVSRQKISGEQVSFETEKSYSADDLRAVLDGTHVDEVTLSAKSFRNVRTLDDLVKFFDVDLDVWEIQSFNVGGSEWDQSVEKGTVAQSVKIKATFVRKKTVEDNQAREALEQALVDLQTHDCLNYEPIERIHALGDGEPFLFELALHDPHFGMLAWGAEVGGVSQDLKIITREYGEAVRDLLRYALLYNTERLLYIVGHDMQHVNQPGMHKKGGMTAGGTAQDIDGRIAKIFTAIRRAVVSGIDQARGIADFVDVMVVPGNHDPDESYKLGEVLNAWYRDCDDVNVIYSPNKRQYYGFGRNVFMMTHGEEYKRKRDSLPLIFATECSAELWVAGDVCREIHTGHNHINMEGGYYPTAEVNETRAIRTRSLPGFTATDGWHHEQGYRHRRSATALIYRKTGGIAGLHEFNL